MPEFNVLIQIESNAMHSAESSDMLTLVAPGTLKRTDTGAEICYMESVDESMPQTNVTLIISQNTLTMHREGDYSADMIFREGSRYEGLYDTPFGSMEMAIFCNQLIYTLNDQEADISISYQLDLNGQFASEHKMHIHADIESEK